MLSALPAPAPLWPTAVAFAEPEYLYRKTAVPNDARYSAMWHLPKISAPAAWDVTTGTKSVGVCVIDTGGMQLELGAGAR